MSIFSSRCLVLLIIAEKEHMMKKLFKHYGKLGAAGLSFIELVIAMAILSVVGIAIGGAMYVSSRSYTRGASEVDVQEEAQVSANLICDWLIDAKTVTPGDGESTSLTIVHPEGNDMVTVTVSYNAGAKTVDYTAVNSAGISVGSGVLASNVTACKFNSTFDKNRNVNISMDFNVNERTYHAVTDTSSRNHDFISTGGGSVDAAPVIAFDIPPIGGEYYVYLEPGQNSGNGAYFEFQAVVYNFDSTNTTFGQPVKLSGTNDFTMTMTQVSGTTDKWTVRCELKDQLLASTNSADYKFTAIKTLAGGTTLVDTEVVHVLAREATQCEFSVDTAVRSSAAGNPNAGKKDCVYEVATVDLGLRNESRQFGAPYDSGTYGYKDPSEVVFLYRFSDGSDASAYINATEVTSGSPSVQIKLAEDLPRDVYVIAVAVHSGELPANTVYNNPLVQSNNKVTKILTDKNGGTYTRFTYGSVTQGGVVRRIAYYDTMKITSNGPGPFPEVGKGIYRGTPAFIVGKFSSQYINNTLYDELVHNAYLNSKGINSIAAIDGNAGKHIKYWTTLWYLEDGTTEWKSFVIGMNDNKPTDLVSDNLLVKLRCNEGGGTGCLFKPDKGYTFKVQLDVFYDSVNVFSDSSTGHVPPATAYVYNPSNGTYDDKTYYNEDNAYVMPNSDVKIPVYFSGCNMQTDAYRMHYRLEVKDGDDYVPVTDSTLLSKFRIEWNGSFGAPGPVVLNDADHTSYDLYNNYEEDAYPARKVSVEVIYIEGGAYSLMPSGNYRIVFDTTYPYIDEVASSGVAGQSVGSASGSTVITGQTFHLSDTSTGSGVIYIKKP